MVQIGNIKVGVRLGLGFALVLALLVLAVGVAVTRLSKLNDGTHIIVNDRYPKVAMVHGVESNLNQIARSMRNVIIVSEQEMITKELATIHAARSGIQETLSKLEKQIQSEKGKDLFKKVLDIRAKYVVHQEAFMKLAAEGKKDEATKLLLSDLRRDQLAYFDALDLLAKFQGELMKSAGEDAVTEYHNARDLMLGLAAVAILLAVGIAVWITRSITRPLNAAVGLAQKVAAGDLTSEIEVKTTDETGVLLRALKDMNDNLRNIVTEVRSGTETVAGVTKQIASGNADLSQRTEEQASSLEETASSMEELTSTVKQNTENARQANQLAATASDIATKGGEVVNEVVSTMSGISDSSKKIVDIIGVIDGIAFQTNILALNAAVEAARAGEQGRGFAVVASEVRTLAQRSAAAAKEIKELITDSVHKVDGGTKLVNEAGKTMEDIVSAVRRVTQIMTDITAAAEEQSSGIEQVNQAVMQMDQVTQQNAALVEEAAAAAESMQEQAQALSAAVAVFKLAEGATLQTSRPVRAEPVQARVERRGPNRAKNVARVPQKREPKLEQSVPADAKKTGTDDWSEF